MPLVTPSTGASYTYPVPGMGKYKIGLIDVTISGTGYNSYLQLNDVVPAGARIIMASMKSASAIPVRLGSTAGSATAGQACAVVVMTAPTSITTSHTTNALVCLTAQSAFGANIPVNQVGVSIFDVAAAATNDLMLAVTTYNNSQLVATADRNLYIVPFAATTAANASQTFAVATATSGTAATVGYCFGTSTSDSYSFDVQVAYEQIVPNVNR